MGILLTAATLGFAAYGIYSAARGVVSVGLATLACLGARVERRRR